MSAPENTVLVTQEGNFALAEMPAGALRALVHKLLDRQDALLDHIDGLKALLDAHGIGHRLPSGRAA